MVFIAYITTTQICMNIFIQILWNMPMYLNHYYFATDLLLLCLQLLVVDIDCSLCNILILDADSYLPWIKWIFLFQSYRIALSVPLFFYFHSVCKFTVFNLNHRAPCDGVCLYQRSWQHRRKWMGQNYGILFFHICEIFKRSEHKFYNLYLYIYIHPYLFWYGYRWVYI